MKDGYYGIVSKRFQQDASFEGSGHEDSQIQSAISDTSKGNMNGGKDIGSSALPSHKFKDHYSVGVIVKIID